MAGKYGAGTNQGKGPVIQVTGASAGTVTKVTATCGSGSWSADPTTGCDPSNSAWGTVNPILIRGGKKVQLTAEAGAGTSVTWQVASMKDGSVVTSPALGATSGGSTSLDTSVAGGWAVGASGDGGKTWVYLPFELVDVAFTSAKTIPNVKLGFYTADDGSEGGFTSGSTGKKTGVWFDTTVDEKGKGWYGEVQVNVTAVRTRSLGSVRLGYLQNVMGDSGTNWTGLAGSYDGGGTQKLNLLQPRQLDGPTGGSVPMYAQGDGKNMCVVNPDFAGTDFWSTPPTSPSAAVSVKVCDTPAKFFPGTLNGNKLTAETGKLSFVAAIVAWTTGATSALTVIAVAWWSANLTGTIRVSYTSKSLVGSPTGAVVTSNFGTLNPPCPQDAEAAGFVVTGKVAAASDGLTRDPPSS